MYFLDDGLGYDMDGGLGSGMDVGAQVVVVVTHTDLLEVHTTTPVH